MTKIIALVVLNACIIAGYIGSGGNVAVLMQPLEVLIIFGAGIGAMFVATPKPVLKDVVTQLKHLKVENENPDLYPQLFGLCNALFTEIQRQGMKVLDQHIEKPEDSSLFLMYPAVLEDHHVLEFLVDNLRLQSMGKISALDLEAIMDEEIHRHHTDALRASVTINKLGEGMPGFGILAAVLGIVITMGKIGGPIAEIGAKVGVALVGTFLGIWACYCFFEPVSRAMEANVDRESARFRCIMFMLVTFAKGKPPMMCIDAGRRQIQPENRPSFAEVERILSEQQF